MTVTTIATVHEGSIHDAKLDFYGSRLATASSDSKVMVWDVSDSKKGARFLGEIVEHDGAVWQVSWSHPRFGLLASCGFDGKIVISKAEGVNWNTVYEDVESQSPVACVSISPSSESVCLAAGCANGELIIVSYSNTWYRTMTLAHTNGITALAWVADDFLVSTGNDMEINSWKIINGSALSRSDSFEKVHKQPITDLSVSQGSERTLLASSCSGGLVVIWKLGTHAPIQELNFPHPAWSVSFSTDGNMLVVGYGDGLLAAFAPGKDDKWDEIDLPKPNEDVSGVDNMVQQHYIPEHSSRSSTVVPGTPTVTPSMQSQQYAVFTSDVRYQPAQPVSPFHNQPRPQPPLGIPQQPLSQPQTELPHPQQSHVQPPTSYHHSTPSPPMPPQSHVQPPTSYPHAAPSPPIPQQSPLPQQSYMQPPTSYPHAAPSPPIPQQSPLPQQSHMQPPMSYPHAAPSPPMPQQSHGHAPMMPNPPHMSSGHSQASSYNFNLPPPARR